MKRSWMCRLTALLLILLMLPWAGAEEAETPEARMMNDLLNYLYYCEILYDDMLWALDYSERYDAERTWETLQLARAAVRLARRDIDALAMPEGSLTSQDIRTLMRKGIDATFFRSDEDSFSMDRTTMLNTLTNLENGIMHDAFMADTWTHYVEWAAIERRLADFNLRWLAWLADAVLAELDDPDWTAQLDEALRTYCPAIAARRGDTPLTKGEAVDTAGAQLMDELEALNKELNRTLGVLNANINDYRQAIENGDLAWLQARAVEISGLPMLVPDEEWLDQAVVTYYWREDGKVLPLPRPGEALLRVPDGCLYAVDGVSLETLREYVSLLAVAGYPEPEALEDAGTVVYQFQMAGSAFSIVWEADHVDLMMTENPVCLVPMAYLLARVGGAE